MITKPKPGATINMAHPLSKGLVGVWLFNEGYGDLANDTSGHGNHGVLKNMLPNAQGTKWAGSKFGGGLAFDGTDDYVDCGNDSSLDITDAITIGVWFKTGITDTFLNLVWKGDGGLILTGWHTTTIYFYLGGVYNWTLDTGVNYGDDKWHHIVFSYDKDGGANNMVIFIDGIKKGETTQTGAITSVADNLMIGKSWNYRFNGTIDQVRIYNRALSAQEIKTLYHDPFCNVLSAHTWQYYMAGAPPHTNLGIGGTITDPSGAAIEGATIKIEDETLSESLDNETSDVNGEYAADLANLASQWNDADVLILKAEARGYRQTVVSAADDSVPSLEINFDNAATRIIMVM